MALGFRTLLLMTCWVCGETKGPEEFTRHMAGNGKGPYIDRRCRPCKWKHMEDSLGRRRTF
jgi:hypothetical protein